MPSAGSWKERHHFWWASHSNIRPLQNFQLYHFSISSWMLVTKRSLARKRTRGFCGRRTRLPSTRPLPSASSTTMLCFWPSWLSAPSTSSRPSPPWSTMSGPCPWQLELWLYCLPPLTSVTYFYCIFLLNLCVKKEMKNLNKQKIWSKMWLGCR